MLFLFQTLLAKALYDNVAETPDELAFKRGDVLSILEQDANGLEGWWLCSFRGKQGIAPGNRLKLLSGMTENGYPENMYQTPPSTNKNWHRRSWDVISNQVLEAYAMSCSSLPMFTARVWYICTVDLGRSFQTAIEWYIFVFLVL